MKPVAPAQAGAHGDAQQKRRGSNRAFPGSAV